MKTALSVFLSVAIYLASATLEAKDKPAEFPAKRNGFLLPNGWTITPAGEQVLLTDLPLNILPLADSRQRWWPPAATTRTNCRWSILENSQSRKPQTVRQSWFGLAITPAQDKLWWSGGGGAALHAFV